MSCFNSSDEDAWPYLPGFAVMPSPFPHIEEGRGGAERLELVESEKFCQRDAKSFEEPKRYLVELPIEYC